MKKLILLFVIILFSCCVEKENICTCQWYYYNANTDKLISKSKGSRGLCNRDGQVDQGQDTVYRIMKCKKEENEESEFSGTDDSTW